MSNSDLGLAIMAGGGLIFALPMFFGAMFEMLLPEDPSLFRFWLGGVIAIVALAGLVAALFGVAWALGWAVHHV